MTHQDQAAFDQENTVLALPAPYEEPSEDAGQAVRDQDAPRPVTFTATYSAEDNKLRLYPSARLPTELYKRVKKAGFNFAKIQELFVAPSWTPRREDLCLELAGELEAEDTTMLERAQAKAARLEGYARNRIADGNAYARAAQSYTERFADGQPILLGHHSQRRAERDAERGERAQKNAAKSIATAAYHLSRAEGAEHHANAKNSTRTRKGRIKTLLKELRTHQKALGEAETALHYWEQANTDKRIEALANNYTLSGRGDYDDLRKGTATHAEVRTRNLANFAHLVKGPNRRRCIAHVLGRLSYEQSFFGATPQYKDDLTPVILQAFTREHGAVKPKAEATETGFIVRSPSSLPAHIGQSKELELTADEWRELMASCGYEVPKKTERRKTTSTKTACPLINPSQAEAERLQALWNDKMQIAVLSRRHTEAKPNQVTPATQKGYSANSKGSYAHCVTIELDANGREVKERWESMKRVKDGTPVCRVRIFTGRSDFYKARSVMQITDKKTAPLPFNWERIEAEQKAERAAEQAKIDARSADSA